MHGEYRESRAGFTLVEILVVLAIVALVSAIAIPGLAKLGAFSRDEFKRSVSELDSLLRAAQIYSTTYNVETAVAYNMDNFSPTETDSAPMEPVTNPIIDSLSGNPVRQIEAAAMLYKVPSGKGPLSGQFVAAPGPLGEFRSFPNGMSLMLNNPEEPPFRPFYFELGASNYVLGAAEDCICSLGMNLITANFADAGPYRFMAHVFKPAGRVSVKTFGTSASSLPCDCNGERFALYVAPSADRPLDERLVFPEQASLVDTSGKPNLMYRKLYIHKSTARVRVPDSQ